MPRKSHRRHRKKTVQVAASAETQTEAEKEQNRLRFESAQRKLDKHLRGRKTPSRDGAIKLLRLKGRTDGTRNSKND